MDWTGARYADKPTVEVSTWIAADPERVWDLVSDIEVMPTLSDELESVEWVDGAQGPGVGATFAGHNKHKAVGRWVSHSHVIEFDAPLVFAWAVGDLDNPAAIWRFRLAPDNGGTTLTYWAQMGPGPSGVLRAIGAMPDKEQEIVFDRMRAFEKAMTSVLAGIKTLAER